VTLAGRLRRGEGGEHPEDGARAGIKSDPEFALKLFSSFSERLRQSDEAIESLLHREVSTRLATLLLNLGERFGEHDHADVLIGVRLTHQDLANMIASTREAVSKVMSELQRDGVIETRNRRIAILDHGALAKRASGLSVDGHLSSTLRPASSRAQRANRFRMGS